MEVKVYVEKCRETAQLPVYAHYNDAGMDIKSAETVLIEPGETVIVPTGIKVAIPDGYEIQVRPRSGISLNTPIRVSNSPATIDAGYRDELGIIFTNTSKQDGNGLVHLSSKGNINGTYIIKTGEKVAQLVLQQVPRAMLIEVESVAGIGCNRGGGYNSTGI